MIKRGLIPPPGSGERDTVVNGVRWRSRELGGAGDVTVVYVHGLLASSATWKDVLAPASDGRPAVAVDLPGFGCSDRPWPFDYSVEEKRPLCIGFLDFRGIGRIALVGNSLGGAVAMLIAAEQPERVAALVLVAPATPDAPIPWAARGLRGRPLGEIALLLSNRWSVGVGLRRRLYARADRVTDEAIADAWFPLTIPGTRRAALALIRSDPGRYRGLEKRIRAPTLVLWGAEDRLLPTRGADDVASRIAHSRLVILPEAGHLPQREVPEAFSRAVASFLGNLSS